MTIQKKIPTKAVRHGNTAVVFNTTFEDVVKRNNLLSFDRVMVLNEGAVVKHAIPERKTTKISLKTRDGTLHAYLKRYYAVSIVHYLKQLIKLSLPTNARNEFRNIIAFHVSGIPTMLPIATGIRRQGLFSAESFLLTQELDHCTRLDHFFSEFPDFPRKQKRQLITKLAQVVSKMHSCGFNHRDLYLCHILCSTEGDLFVVDLHRVEKRKTVPQRWKVKDIAALNYSAPWNCISRTDRLWFFENYLGTQKLSAHDKLFILKVLKKTEKMVQHNKSRKQ